MPGSEHDDGAREADKLAKGEGESDEYDRDVPGKLLAYADAIAVIQETSRLLNPAAGQRLVCREVTQRLVDAMAALRGKDS